MIIIFILVFLLCLTSGIRGLRQRGLGVLKAQQPAHLNHAVANPLDAIVRLKLLRSCCKIPVLALYNKPWFYPFSKLPFQLIRFLYILGYLT